MSSTLSTKRITTAVTRSRCSGDMDNYRFGVTETQRGVEAKLLDSHDFVSSANPRGDDASLLLSQHIWLSPGHSTFPTDHALHEDFLILLTYPLVLPNESQCSFLTQFQHISLCSWRFVTHICPLSLCIFHDVVFSIITIPTGIDISMVGA